MIEDVEGVLRGAHLRVTRPRMAVLNALQESPHADTATVIEMVRARHTAVSHQAVYDCLGALTDAGLVRRIQPTGSVARYELQGGDNHHHAVCRGCGSITDVDCAVGKAPCLHASRPHGFTVDEAEVIFWGLCPTCQSATTASPTATTTSTTTDTTTATTATAKEGRL